MDPPDSGKTASRGLTEGLPEDILFLGFTHAPLAALGPGIRVGVWTKGCGLRCPGCLAPELQAAAPEDAVGAAALARWALEAAAGCGASGLTVSGGEPFYRPEALRAFLEKVREGGLRDILVYSGWRVQGLLEAWPWIPVLVSALVDGPFEESRPTESPWKGSEGQGLTVFDPGLEGLYARWRDSGERPLQLVPFPGGLRILGIPRIGAYDRIP